jgi:hypothetical protein
MHVGVHKVPITVAYFEPNMQCADRNIVKTHKYNIPKKTHSVVLKLLYMDRDRLYESNRHIFATFGWKDA